jgi:hypothetical protein
MSRVSVPALPMTLLLGALLLGACDKSAPGSAPAAATGTPPAATAAGAPAAAASVDAATAGLNASEPPLPDLGDFKLVSVLIGSGVDNEQLVLADTRRLAFDKPIYASVLSIGAHQGLKLSADWIAPDGRSFTRSVQPVVPTSDLATTFKVENPAGWPAGAYQLRIAIDGHTIRTENFEVR